MKTGKLIILIVILLFNPLLTGALQNESSIVKIDGKDIYVNWGSNDGIARGVVFNIYRSEDRSHPITGEDVDKQSLPIGSIKIFEVFPEYSIGRLQSRVQDPQVGDYLELIVDSGEENPAGNTQMGSVTNIDKGRIEINVGSEDGIQEGLLFDVVRDMVLKHPVTGEMLDRRKYIVGKISVSSVDKNSSICNVLSGWEDIRIDDEIALSEKQRSDMGVDIAQKETSQQIPLEKELVEILIPEKKEIPLHKFFGKVIQVNNKTKTIVFSWDKGFDGSSINQGANVGLYRKERVVHPITKVEIGSPEILIGKGNYVRTVKGNGEVKVLIAETSLKKGDMIGILTEEPISQVTKRTTETTIGKPLNLKQEAERLTQEVVNIQNDIDELKLLKNRISAVEKGISSQREITNKLRKDVEEINNKLTLLVEGGGASPIPSQTTTMELYGTRPEDVKTYQIKYTDDINVKVQFQDNTLLVSLGVDSTKTKEIASVTKTEKSEIPIEETGEETGVKETEEVVDISEIEGETEKITTSNYIQYILKYKFHIIGGVVGLAALYLVFSFLKKRGGEKKKSAGKGELDFEEADEDLEEVEEEEETVE